MKKLLYLTLILITFLFTPTSRAECRVAAADPLIMHCGKGDTTDYANGVRLNNWSRTDAGWYIDLPRSPF